MPQTTAPRACSPSSGIAGIGKSRLAWEFEKYVDGLADDGLVAPRAAASPTATASRTGRSPRWCACARASPRTSRPTRRCRSCARRSTRRSPTRRSARGSSRGSRTCSALGEPQSFERQDLFAAWRLFFERLSDRGPVVLVFEDLQWADASLLDFVEHLLDWSRTHPIFVLALTRPEIAERRAGLGERRAVARRRSRSTRSPTGRCGSCSGRFVPGPARRARGRDPRALAGRSPLRGRDGAHAARPRSAHAGRRPVRGRRADRLRSRCRRRCMRWSRHGSTI